MILKEFIVLRPMLKSRKFYCMVIGFTFLVLFVFPFNKTMAAKGRSSRIYKSRKVNPRNLLLIRKGLLPPSILKYFPEVPKITPYEALALYRANKAVFIAVGADPPRLQNGWLLEKNYMGFNPKRLKRYKIPLKGKFIILYCG